MQQPTNTSASVSDIYGVDEIDFLLDEIRDLEPACCQLDDVQDFEIAGSRAGEFSITLDSPVGTCTSWDSHAQYKYKCNENQTTWGVPLHCDGSHLKTSTGIVRFLLVLSSAACLLCECSAGTLQVGIFLLPLIGRLRLMVFCALFSILFTCLLLFLDISHIGLMFPFNWAKVNTWMFLGIGLMFILSSSLICHTVFLAEAFLWVPKHTKDILFISAILGYLCAIEAFILCGISIWPPPYKPVVDDANEVFIPDCEMSHISPTAENTDVSFNSNPVKSPGQSYNKTAASTNLTQNRKSIKNREGYHYQPIASTSRQSPTFILD
ncbi:uncharacterized protein LOC129616310 isoform X2 [Condylostylus longicornis]|uniref:uncharacterized protein LOC129616310 isoform X2 n=1 Tax=Condylostylus longicornis TaxID=2530218 RepID=UPI00244E1A9C|nr:uncharacterized protein LOC129616310 isoform X2 [Condylostylus longicornis]